MNEEIKLYERHERIKGNSHTIFLFMDDLAKTGMHMSKRSVMMAGSKLTLVDITKNGTGVGSTFRWYGKMMGMTIDITETVTESVMDKSKKWETIGDAQVILFSWYQMGYEIVPEPNSGYTNVRLWIRYKKPKTWFYRLLSFLFAKLYCRWCLKNMLDDTKQHAEQYGDDAHKKIAA